MSSPELTILGKRERSSTIVSSSDSDSLHLPIEISDGDSGKEKRAQSISISSESDEPLRIQNYDDVFPDSLLPAFCCKICNQYFGSTGALIQHKLKKHKKKPRHERRKEVPVVKPRRIPFPGVSEPTDFTSQSRRPLPNLPPPTIRSVPESEVRAPKRSGFEFQAIPAQQDIALRRALQRRYQPLVSTTAPRQSGSAREDESDDEVDLELSEGRAQSAGYPPPLRNAEDAQTILRGKGVLLLVDLDNWSGFFRHLRGILPDSVFVWAFRAEQTFWRPPVLNQCFNRLRATQSFFLQVCGRSKDAADFALCVHAGNLHNQLPRKMPFIILSGDRGFEELTRQLHDMGREVFILNPHHEDKDTVWARLMSVCDMS